MNRPFSLGPVLATALLMVGCSAAAPLPTATPVPAPSATPRPTSTPFPTSTLAPAATPPPPAATLTPLPPPISTDFPSGTFYHRHPGAFCVLQLNKGGTWAYFFMTGTLDVSGTEPTYRGTFNTRGNLYTETSVTGIDCRWPGTYAWSYDGTSLAFQAAGEEKCPDRQRTYEGPEPWTKAN